MNTDGIVENVELNLTLSSNVPRLQLKWLQNASSYAPKLFINDVSMKGIDDDDNNNDNDDNNVKSQDMKNNNSGKQKSNCKLDKVIDFNEDG